MAVQGILLVDKPSGWTSFDVVNYVRKQVAQVEGKKPKNCKVGHTGTLDPLATGLLVLLIGKEYTRRAADMSKHDKTYQVTAKLGQNSDTGDEEGQKTTVSNVVPTRKEVSAALSAFTGNLLQTPPAYSAIKIDGQRAYKLAREGKTVTIEPRPVTIYGSELTEYSYPYIRFTCRVSSGTYIRTLVEDIGKYLQTGAYMSDLRRTEVDAYSVEQSVLVTEVDLGRIIS